MCVSGSVSKSTGAGLGKAWQGKRDCRQKHSLFPWDTNSLTSVGWWGQHVEWAHGLHNTRCQKLGLILSQCKFKASATLGQIKSPPCSFSWLWQQLQVWIQGYSIKIGPLQNDLSPLWAPGFRRVQRWSFGWTTVFSSESLLCLEPCWSHVGMFFPHCSTALSSTGWSWGGHAPHERSSTTKWIEEPHEGALHKIQPLLSTHASQLTHNRRLKTVLCFWRNPADRTYRS